MEKRADRKNIGDLIKISRKIAGLSQMQLAERIGVSYQQVQKYENGLSELSISRLSQIAHALNMSVNRFIPDEKIMVAESVNFYGTLNDDEIELVKFFRNIKSKKLKYGFLAAVKGISPLKKKKKYTKKKAKSHKS
ncbi:MAG: helix-turn-helix transcriptional regulator [Nitrospirae bacterium]|nr:helix-turn-helix transcriptional regulator [Nitrospirota bacterium]